ncbi:MAG: hypothetical protein COW32_06855 [Candidatus Aquicultor secundus]|uniref:HD domain-containing protein n=1 Tax=Candidatus Aquicultor secundus TaxID=1973895 RepID=A0A2M7T9C6_9ACTN|nr:HD domain-containing phosphohydrolase [Candidatus Aquicultor secundus]NCO65953.1 HD domain-containing protein [Solirubrobacter sp.]OIO86042.1 MAG: hypothetical protein AUK32_06130 [Candidatus Aquicultor secundus]PIU27378.1 MAG: hypothetical protein COT10_03720 [Candidatus Aquicultor secundus]PIW21998.1 MAG: hypothetical protein COW32_06855 [Candidatus Aquicultor secundus]PIX52594.1 MAG: hypothetical protein COZ51_03360 [Candidatus Aquicultor secundus]
MNDTVKKGIKRKTLLMLMALGVILPNIFALIAWYSLDSDPGAADKPLQSFLYIAVFNIAYAILGGTMAVLKTHNPLYKLTLAAEQLAEGNLNVACNYHGIEEIDRLVTAFENIRNSMSNSYGAIQEYIDELRGRVEELKLLTDIDAAILGGQKIDSIFNLITEGICKLVGADYCCIALLDGDKHIQIRSLHGFGPDESREFIRGIRGKTPSINICPSIASGQILLLGDLNDSNLSDDVRQMYARFNVKSMIAAPLSVDGEPIGSVVVWYKDRQEFSDMVVNRFLLFADQISVALKSARLVDGIRNLTIEVIRALAKAVDARDSYTANHSNRVSRFAVALAQGLGMNQKEVETIEYAGLLHDIGKIGIDERILNKPGALTEQEMELMKSHASMSADIVKPIEFLKGAVPIVKHHHEWFNGGGYPSGLAGDAIPYGARILAVADAIEAMTSSRPYREEMPLRQGAEQLKSGSGTQFDPEIVEVMLKVVERIELIESFDSENGSDDDKPQIGFEDAV